jgi:hypothetical protein
MIADLGGSSLRLVDDRIKRDGPPHAAYFRFQRSQLLLLPETVDDYVGADNPVRFIDASVDQLDLAVRGFIRVVPLERPALLIPHNHRS